MAAFSRGTGTGWLQDDPASAFSRGSGTGWDQLTDLGGLPVNGSSSGTFDLTGSAAGIIFFSVVMGASAGTFDLTGSATGIIATLPAIIGSSDGTFDLTGSATGTIALPAFPVIGSSDGIFTLSGSSTGHIDGSTFGCTGLPPGWIISREVEVLPALDPPPIAAPTFARITYVCRDEIGSWVCASGWAEDCCNQAHSIAQSRTQQFPYNENT